MSDASEFTIQEQTGDRRTLFLTERALPYRPIEYSGEQRAEFTVYPGNPIKTMQVLGAEEDPTEIHGMWKDRFLTDTSGQSVIAWVLTVDGQRTPLRTAIDLVDVVNDIRRKGQEVVVQWGPKVRRGLLKKFIERWHNIHDVEWVIRFEWVSQNDPDAPVVLAKDTDNSNFIGTLQSGVQQLQNLVNTALNTDAAYIVSAQIGAVNAAITNVAGLVQQLSDTTTNVVVTAMPIVDQQRRIAGILNDVANSSGTVMATVFGVPAVSVAQVAFVGGPIDGPALAVEYINRQLYDTARDMQANAMEAQFSVLKSINPDIIAMFVARNDTDLRDVSTRFYGTQDDWRSIMVFNQLSVSRLSAGQVVFIPQLLRPLDGSQ